MASRSEYAGPKADAMSRLSFLQEDIDETVKTVEEVVHHDDVPGWTIKGYLLEKVPEFRQLAELRQKGWENPEGDRFFRLQREKADKVSVKTAKVFYQMMIGIAKELHAATGGLTIPQTKGDGPRVLDLCMAPGGFLRAVLDLNPGVQAVAFSLPANQGGHRVFSPKRPDVSVKFLDITLLAGDMGVTAIPLGHPDEKNFTLKPQCGSEKFGLVVCDGQVLRTHTRPAYRETVEARRLALTQLVIGLEHLQPGGTVIMLLHKVEAWMSVKLMYTFSKFSSLQLFKSSMAHQKRSSFYIVARDVRSEHAEALATVKRWKREWRVVTFEGLDGEEKGGDGLEDDADDGFETEGKVGVERVLDEFGLELVEMGREIWAIQARPLARAPFCADVKAKTTDKD